MKRKHGSFKAHIKRYRKYHKRVEAMLTAAVEVESIITTLLVENQDYDPDMHGDVVFDSRLDPNTTGYEGFEEFMAPCIIGDWTLTRQSAQGGTVQFAVRVTTSFDDGAVSHVSSARSDIGDMTGFSVTVELAPDTDDFSHVKRAVQERVLETMSQYTAPSI